MLGSALVAHDRGHVRIEVIGAFVGPRGQRLVQALAGALTWAFTVILAVRRRAVRRPHAVPALGLAGRADVGGLRGRAGRCRHRGLVHAVPAAAGHRGAKDAEAAV